MKSVFDEILGFATAISMLLFFVSMGALLSFSMLGVEFLKTLFFNASILFGAIVLVEFALIVISSKK